MQVKNWPIGRKLFALAATGLIVALAIGGMAYVDVGRISTLTAGSAALGAADRNLRLLENEQSEVEVAMRDMLLAVDDQADRLAQGEFDEAAEKVTGWLAALDALTLPGDLETSTRTLDKDVRSWLAGAEDELPVLQKTQPGTKAATAQLDVSRKLGDDMAAQIATFREQVSQHATRDQERLASTISAVRRTVVIALVVALVVLLAVARYLTTLITRPIGHLIESADKLAVGDCAFQVEVTGTDETGRALAAMQRMKENIQAVIADVTMLGQAALEGRLDARADAERHQGDYRTVVDGINQTLDAVTGPVGEVERVFGAMEAGDLSRTSDEAKQLAIVQFYERMVVVERQLGRIQEALQLG
jgi:methyl-accepting chemotaxis protein